MADQQPVRRWIALVIAGVSMVILSMVGPSQAGEMMLCSAAGPECNGACPPGDTCVNPGNGQQARGATTSALSLCLCVPEIPEGGACAQQPDACALGLVCQNGICAVAAAPAPLLSSAGLGIAFASLVGLGGLAFIRRRRHG